MLLFEVCDNNNIKLYNETYLQSFIWDYATSL